jgi:hypothetical protein
MSCEQNGRPLGREGFDGWSGGDMGGFDFKDAELGGLGSLMGGLIRFFAERALGQAGTGLARRYELAGELDEISRDIEGRIGFLKDGRLAKGNLVIKKVEGFGLIKHGLSLRLVSATD